MKRSSKRSHFNLNYSKPIKTNIFLERKHDEYDNANRSIQESLNKKTNQMKKQSEIDKLMKQLQVMRVERDIQKAEGDQLIQAF